MMPVYFIQAGEGGPVKIGYASNPRRRLAQLQSANPTPLILLRVIDGGPHTEAHAHDIFSTLRLRGEWHRFSPNMLSACIPAVVESAPLANPHRTEIEILARDLGATDFQVAKWRQRGVPDAWRWRITRAAKDAARRIPEDAFERVAPKRRAA